MSATKDKKLGAAQVDVSERKERVIITTTSGKVFEVVVYDEQIEVFASTGFGCGLVVKPGSNNKITLSQDKI